MGSTPRLPEKRRWVHASSTAPCICPLSRSRVSSPALNGLRGGQFWDPGYARDSISPPQRRPRGHCETAPPCAAGRYSSAGPSRRPTPRRLLALAQTAGQGQATPDSWLPVASRPDRSCCDAGRDRRHQPAWQSAGSHRVWDGADRRRSGPSTQRLQHQPGPHRSSPGRRVGKVQTLSPVWLCTSLLSFTVSRVPPSCWAWLGQPGSTDPPASRAEGARNRWLVAL